MDVRAAILENWPYKAAAIVLSILLWFNVTADQQRQDQALRTRLEFEVGDTAWSLLEAPTEVMTVFQGRRGDMIGLFNEPVIRKTIDEVTGPEMEIVLSPADVAYDRSLNVRPLDVRPQRVTVRFERRVTRRVPLVAETRVEPAEGFVRGRVVVDEDSVTVRGPQSVVLGIARLRTRPVAPDSLVRGSVSRQVDVAIPPDLEGIDVDPAQVFVTVEIDSIAQRSFDVPVQATGPAAAGTRLEPDRVRITVRGAWGAVQGLAASDVHAVVRIDSPVSGERSAVVSVELPPDLTATATADPARVTVSRGAGP